LSTPQADYYRLRTEWLRFRSQLFDGLTGLPALPAVVEDVRRLLDARGSAQVLYLDLGHSGWHETKLGWAAYDRAVQDFAAMIAALQQSGSFGEGSVVCLLTVRSDRFLIFVDGGPESDPAGPTRGEAILSVVRQETRHFRGGSLLGTLQVGGGQARIENDPMVRSERAIQQAVAAAMLASLVQREGIDAARRDELARMIADGSIRSVFHPIVRLVDAGVIGHEALTRPLRPTSFASVEELFAFAESTELLVEFERLCRGTAVRSAASVPGLGLLFLNASARAVEDPQWSSGVMDRALAGSGLTPGDVVVEITERLAIVRHEDFQSALRTFKRRGYRVAVDDMGAGYASLQALASIEPDFLKFDVSLVRDIDRSSIKRSLLESLRLLADKIRARVIAEGIEREGEKDTLLDLGIELGQGFYFHREGE
jgi:EAL domain-containing protein (putative c-di-GMP-specific phosphodiesterase class I)